MKGILVILFVLMTLLINSASPQVVSTVKTWNSIPRREVTKKFQECIYNGADYIVVQRVSYSKDESLEYDLTASFPQ